MNTTTVIKQGDRRLSTVQIDGVKICKFFDTEQEGFQRAKDEEKRQEQFMKDILYK